MSGRAIRVALAASAVALAALPAAAAAAPQQVAAAGDQFVPRAIVAGSGDTLTFDNTDITSHNVTSATPGVSFGTAGNVAPGASAIVTGVDKLAPGTYTFVCTLHPGMSATLQVLPAGGGGPGPPGPPPVPSPGGTPNPVDLLPKVAPAPLTASEWPMYGHDLGNSRAGASDAPSWNEAATLGPVWSFQSTNGDFTGTPVESAGTVVVGSFNGSVYALDASTGALRWRHDFTNAPINGSAAIDGGHVFVPLATPSAPSVAALNLADGTLAWQTQIDSQQGSDVYGSPVVSNGAVYIGVSALSGELSNPNVSVRGSVVALDAATGTQLWKTYMVPPGDDGGAVWSTPAIDPAAGLIYVGTGNAYHAPAAPMTDSIVALNTAGAVVNHFQATAGDIWNETGNPTGVDADFGASPQFITGAGGRQLIGDGQKSGTYWAIDRATLQPVWNTITQPQTSFVGAIVASTAWDGTRIYGTDAPAGEVWSLNPDGSYAWLSTDAGPLQYGPPAVANGVLYDANMTGFVTARDVTTGAVLAKLPLGAPSWGGVAIAGGYVYAVTGTQGATGYVVAYRPRG